MMEILNNNTSRKRPLRQLIDNNISNHNKIKVKVCDNACLEQGPQKRAGTVTNMVLRNFMCHSLLEVNLKSNINYIIGHNGSGKSAILTALAVGLGAKANTTNRGSNIKNFVKAGKNSASVEIVLNNSGPMAFRPSVFGNQITIQRNFSLAGNSSYKIKSASGAVISTSFKEMQHITAALNIQVDNPICILNQDTSRNFLSTSSSKQKFILFMKATQLETLFDEYKKIREHQRTSIRLYKEKEQVYKDLQVQMIELKKKIESHCSIIKLKDKLTLFQRELLWAKVRDSEEEFYEQAKRVEKLHDRYVEMKDNFHNRAQKLEEIKQRVSELQQQIIELKDAAEVQNQSQLDLQHAIDELKQKYNAKHREKQTATMTIENKAKDCEVLQKEIDNFTATLTQIEQEKLERLREIDNLERKIKRIENVIETSRNDMFQLKNNIGRIQEEERDFQKELNKINTRYGNIKESLTALKSENSNSLLLYGRDMPQIIAAIDASKSRFTQMPRGPLGSYINIRNKKWAVAVEGFIGPGLLQSFVVDNKKDNLLLMEIFNKYWRNGSKPTIITSKFFHQVHDISRNLVHAPSDCTSVYDAIDVLDPIVANCIIDQMNIENVLLIPSNDRAMELMSVATRVPKNCKQGITISGDKYFPDPNYKTYASRYKQARYLQVNTADLISQYDEKMQDLLEKRGTVQNQYSAVRADKLEQQNRLRELSSKLDKLKLAYSIAKRKLDDHKESAEPESVNVHSLESELTEVKQSIEQKNVDIKRMEEEMRDIKQSIRENEERLTKLKEVTRDFEDRIEPLEQQVMEQGAKKRDLNVNDNFEKKRIQEYKDRLEHANSDMLQKQKFVEEQTRQAETVGTKLDEIRKVPDIVSCINNVQKSIKKIETEVESPEETRRKYEAMMEKYREVSDVMVSLRNNIEELQKAVANRNRHYKCTEDYFITFLNHNFTKVLEFRQFKGSLEIDMDQKKLDLVVIPQQGSQGHTATSNLSGGERSFSTVAFLYALWQCMDFPFYFLDEFDVFMDRVNRTRVMEILIHHAKSRPDLQFVFLTPQDVSFINDDSVAIHRLEDPKRRAVQ